jgi:hypothetical protein
MNEKCGRKFFTKNNSKDLKCFWQLFLEKVFPTNFLFDLILHEKEELLFMDEILKLKLINHL